MPGNRAQRGPCHSAAQGPRLVSPWPGRKPLVYLGPSMYPTLLPLDVLETVPCDGPLRVGDVVAFPDPEGEGSIIHRVVAIMPEGVRTQGDNNGAPDNWTLQPADLIGQVVRADRRGRAVRVWGGLPGRSLACALRVRRALAQLAYRLLRPLYRALARLGPFRPLGRGRPLRLLRFERPGGAEWQALSGGRVIARCPPGRREWQITPPFHLLIDEASLPPLPADPPDSAP